MHASRPEIRNRIVGIAGCWRRRCRCMPSSASAGPSLVKRAPHTCHACSADTHPASTLADPGSSHTHAARNAIAPLFFFATRCTDRCGLVCWLVLNPGHTPSDCGPYYSHPQYSLPLDHLHLYRLSSMFYLDGKPSDMRVRWTRSNAGAGCTITASERLLLLTKVPYSVVTSRHGI